jgi:DNA processing protein
MRHEKTEIAARIATGRDRAAQTTTATSKLRAMDRAWLRETASLVALLRTKKDSTWSEVSMSVEEAGSAAALLEANGPDQLFPAREGQRVDLEAIEDEVRSWLDEGMNVITVLDPVYPSNLRTVHELPPLLFVQGEMTEQDDRGIAVVGSRNASERGLERADQVARELVRRGYIVASGLARGIDTAAHRGALDAGGRTIAVLGNGLRHAYPPENAELQAQLGRESAVISQFFPHQRPTKWTFPLRNAVMSGLSNATVVVEATERSGARMQARLAAQHGRPVFLPRDLVETQDWARDYAERPGTHVFDSPDEIADRIDSLLSVETLTA